MSQADVLQQPLSFDFEGKPLPFAICALKHEIAFQTYLERQARDVVARSKPVPNDPSPWDWTDYQRMLDGYRHDCVSGAYEWEGEVATRSRYSVTGQKELCFLLLASETPTVTRQLVDKIFRDADTRAALLALYWRSLGQARPRPPLPAPEAA